jgi:DNA-binding MarR family transcriptional regulator
MPSLPRTTAREREENLAILLREPFRTMTSLLHERLARRGYADVRTAHGTVFQFLDDDGTAVSELARRAQMSKQSMAELVRHLEAGGYVERVEDPGDRRARPVRATTRGREVFAAARELAAEVEVLAAERMGVERLRALRGLLEELQAALPEATS